MTTYQRLKQENADLRRRLHVVCVSPRSEEAQIIIRVELTVLRIEDAIWKGDVGPGGSKFGLLKGFI